MTRSAKQQATAYQHRAYAARQLAIKDSRYAAQVKEAESLNSQREARRA